MSDSPVEIKEQAGTVRRLDSRFYCTINGKLYVRWEYAGGPEQCKHGYARCFACPECEKVLLAKPTPTVIPDAKNEKESAPDARYKWDKEPLGRPCPKCHARIHHFCTSLALMSKGDPLSPGHYHSERKLPQESKPLPSEPQLKMPQWSDSHMRAMAEAESEAGNINIGSPLSETQQERSDYARTKRNGIARLAAEPSEGLAAYLRNSDLWDAIKRNESGAAVQVVSQLVRAVWNVAKAEKVENSTLDRLRSMMLGFADGLRATTESIEWPEAVVSDEKLAGMIAMHGVRGLGELLTELQAYRELKKRSVGGVK